MILYTKPKLRYVDLSVSFKIRIELSPDTHSPIESDFWYISL